MCVIRHGGKTTTKPGSETDRTPWRSYGTSPSDSSASTANTRSKKRPKRSAETGTEPSTYYSPKVTIMTDGNHDAALRLRRRRVRRRVLRYQPARGAGDGPAAAAVA